MFNKILSNWNKILEETRLGEDMTDVSFNTWLTPLKPLSYNQETGVLTVLFPHDVIQSANYIMKRYGFILQYEIEEITGIKCTLSIVISEQEKEKNAQDALKNAPVYQSNLNSRYTFDSFVVGNNNKLAHSAALAVAESPATDYNPLFIHGGSGLGKTHLIQAIGNFTLKRNPAVKVLYVTCDKFTNELIEAIRNRTNAEFREKYRNIDVLIIDDIQFIAGKESTQLEVFHTFNALYENKKQIVLTSDRPPKEIETLEERLRSRFSSGLIVEITLPDYETRMAILRKKEETEGYNVDNEIIKYIATNIKSNIRELEGALTKVVAMSRLSGKPLTLESAIQSLQDSITPETEKELSLPYILKIVCEHFNVQESDITSDRRDANIVLPRQVFMYLCKEVAKQPGTTIGKYLGKDHSTIIHGCEKISRQLASDKNLQNAIEVLKKKISL